MGSCLKAGSSDPVLPLLDLGARSGEESVRARAAGQASAAADVCCAAEALQLLRGEVRGEGRGEPECVARMPAGGGRKAPGRAVAGIVVSSQGVILLPIRALAGLELIMDTSTGRARWPQAPPPPLALPPGERKPDGLRATLGKPTELCARAEWTPPGGPM